MKRCPECGRDYNDDSLSFCLDDGAELLFGPGAGDEPATAILHETAAPSESRTRAQIHTTEAETRTSLLGQLPEDEHLPKRSAVKWLVSLGAVIAVLLGGFFAYRYVSDTGSGQIDSIAVLPFQNTGGNPDAEYLSDGLAESLIYRLSQIPELKVSPRSSAFRYKGHVADAEQVGGELQVDAVLSGRLVQRGDNLTISVDLVDVQNRKTIWGEQFERKMSDLLATQREIASTIVDKLQLKLSGAEQKGITKRYTDNSEAYQHYLKGRHHWNKRTKDAMEQGLVHFQKAIDLDPKFALAHVGIADSYFVMPSYAYVSPKEAFPKAIAASKRALEIDPDLAEAHSTYGSVLTYEFQWLEAEREIKRALELDPNSAESHYRYSLEFLAPVGRLDEAITEIKRAIELEPLSLPIGANLAGLYMQKGNNEAALEQALKINALDPMHATSSYWLGWAYVANGKYAEALALCDRVLPSDPENQDLMQIKGFAYAKLGRPDETRLVLKHFAELEKRKYVVAYRIATLHAVLGEKDQAFRELERSYGARDWDFTRLKIDPFVAALHDDPRFDALVKRLNLPE